MCGYVRRHIANKDLKEFMDLLGLDGLFPETGGGELQHFYPAFGKNASRTIDDLVIREDAHLKRVNATWWFDCKESDGQLFVGDRTTFNARNLESPYWKGAIRNSRGIVVGTGLGESKMINGKKHQFLMRSVKPILLGAVYRRFPNDLYSCAVITRDSHPRFDAYHDKAFPLFLPYDKGFLQLWLSDEREDHPAIASLLNQPRLFADLDIAEVKTFKAGEVKGPDVRLQSD